MASLTTAVGDARAPSSQVRLQNPAVLRILFALNETAVLEFLQRQLHALRA